jgi:hypothetical protein
VSEDIFTPALFFVVAGLVGGLALFARGLVAYRRDRLISSVATSSLDGIAAGEVRVTGVVKPIEQTLISPLQSAPCVWYRARVETTGKNSRVLLDEEKSQEFHIRNETGQIRVVPRGARWEIRPVFDEGTSWSGSEPVGLQRRSGPAYAAHVERDPEQMTELERATAAQTLLTVQQPAAPEPGEDWLVANDWSASAGLAASTGKRYREARLEPGQTVTILGQAWPWGEVREVLLTWNPSSNVEADIAGDIAYARETGTLAASAEEAWGNAAIPGFGIDAPTAEPELDPRAHQPDAPGGEVHEDALEKYDIPDEELVLSRGLKGGMAIYAGSSKAATSHHDMAFVLGIVGAVMAALCAFGIGAIVTGTL